MEINFWVLQINIQDGLSVEHVTQFSKHWEMLSHIHLTDGTPDFIKWKLTTNGLYSSPSAYKMQFEALLPP
jgi:hypothetical protein